MDPIEYREPSGYLKIYLTYNDNGVNRVRDQKTKDIKTTKGKTYIDPDILE